MVGGIRGSNARTHAWAQSTSVSNAPGEFVWNGKLHTTVKRACDLYSVADYRYSQVYFLDFANETTLF